jgi:hypothetical protein
MFPQTKSIICFIAMQSYKRENCAGKCKSLHEYKTCLVMHEEHAYSASVYESCWKSVYLYIKCRLQTGDIWTKFMNMLTFMGPLM